MSNVYYLQHKMIYSDDTSRKGIGIYESFAKATQAMARVRHQPGFIDPRGAFSIYRCQVERSYWPGGLDVSSNEVRLAHGDDEQSVVLATGTILYLAYLDNPEADDEAVLIGYFSTRVAAQRALDAARSQGHPTIRGEFDISTAVVDSDNWVEGFVAGP